MHSNMTYENSAQYKTALQKNTSVETGLQKRANEYEEDRIGQGKIIGQNLAIGAPDLAERNKHNIEANITQLPPLIINKDQGSNKNY